MENVITKETSKKISIIQAIFTVMVVYIHAYNLDVYGIANNGGFDSFCYYLERILYYFTAVAVPGFFFLSGYLFYVTLRKDNILKKYKNRVYSLIIPYLIWNSVGYLFWIILEKIPAIAQKLSMEHSWTLTPASFGYAFIAPVNSPLWYMRNLFVVLLFAIPIWFCIKQKWGIIPLAGLLVASVLIKADKYNIVYDLFLFALGGYIAINFNNQFQTKYMHIRLLSFLTICVYVIVSFVFPEIDYNRYGAQLLVDTALFSSFWFCFNGTGMHGNGIIGRISETRTFIYFSHSILIESMEKLFLIIVGKNVFAALADYIIIPILVIFILTAVGKIFQMRMPKLWRILNGYR